MEHVLSSIELVLSSIYWLRSRADTGHQAFPRVLTVRSQSGHVFCGCFVNVNKILSFLLINRHHRLPLIFFECQTMSKKP